MYTESNIFDKIRESGFSEYFRPFLYMAGIVILFVAGSVILGIQIEQNERPCYTETLTCHGLSVNGTADSCMGFLRESTNFEDRNSCGQVDQMKSSCTDIKQILCSQGTSNWREQAQVHGKSCKVWDEKYALGLSSC